MKKLNRICISLLSVLTLLFQVYPASTVRAEDAVTSEKIELKAENKTCENEDTEALSMDEPSEEDNSTVTDPSENLTYVTFDAAISEGVSKEGNKYIWHANSNASGHGVSYRVNTLSAEEKHFLQILCRLTFLCRSSETEKEIWQAHTKCHFLQMKNLKRHTTMTQTLSLHIQSSTETVTG